MSSSYLDLYTGAGGYYGGFGGNQLMPKPTIGTQQGTYRSGTTQRVVHDKANNIYYGQQKQSDLIRGLEDSILRTQMGLKSPYATRVINRGTIFQQEQRYKRSAQEIKAMNDQITSQQAYLKHIQGGGYKQEGSQFYESYDAYTGDWNNVFKRRKSNADRTESNRLQVIENKKIERRNKKIEGENQIREAQALKQQDTKISTGSNAMPKSLKPKLTINTGVTANADKLVKSLNTGLSI